MMANNIKEMETVIVERRGKIGIITLNRPDKRNSLTDTLLNEMYAAVTELDQDEEIRVLIVKGAGKAFCAGYDLSPREEPFTTVLQWRTHAKHGNRLMFSIWNCRKPVIAQIQGYALGGGCDLAMVCDFTIAAESCMLGEPEIQFNSAPPFGNIMPNLIGMKKTKALLLTGDRISASEAERIGLVTACVPDDKLEEEVMALAKKLVKVPVPAMRLNKEAINRNYEISGMLDAIHFNEEIFADVLMSETPEAAKFFEIQNKEGLAAAFKWRDAFFAEENPEN
ncbi:enoyl-CoA hydratase/isomerase family protein [Oscillibacter sp. PC13]|uniref:enoyl-CoA hydratase/isomerase family protein n=1 Tax=Oscillibacter sp. PC13 TaxID=1855299 RepID=UPI001A9A6A8E|nr:enoyl-CoA hydratase/isomerase family protein [Oscillibacter sp. PC13]